MHKELSTKLTAVLPTVKMIFWQLVPLVCHYVQLRYKNNGFMSPAIIKKKKRCVVQQ